MVCWWVLVHCGPWVTTYVQGNTKGAGQLTENALLLWHYQSLKLMRFYFLDTL
jgi:hypothetical protein